MAVDKSSNQARVIGCSGTPVRGGAGIKPAIIERPTGHFYLDTGKSPDVDYDTAQIDEFVQRGLLCRTQRSWTAIPNGVILYAHRAFVTPEQTDLLHLAQEVAAFEQDKPLDVFLEYLPLKEAKAQLQQWGLMLLDDAEQQVRNHNFNRALDSAERAGYTVLSSNNKRDHAFNKRVFVCLAAAYIGLRRRLRDVLEDARIDFSKDDVDEIDRKARALIYPPAPDHAEQIMFYEADYPGRRLVKCIADAQQLVTA